VKVIIFAALGLCLLTGACDSDGGTFDIDIGDYEYHWEAWNSQNMLDYQINLSHGYPDMWQNVHNIIIKNGIPESNDCSKYWLEAGMISTIPEFFSLIKNYEKHMNDAHNSGDNRSLSLKVSYNTEYHYPRSIISEVNGWKTQEWLISLMQLEEGELDIDIGDYEYHLEAWNNQDMFDYQVSVKMNAEFHVGRDTNTVYVYNVKNDIPDRDIYLFGSWRKVTIPEIYSLIKEEEERIRNKYNGVNRPYLRVKYHTVYHYPIEISSGVDFFSCHLFDCLEIILMPEETE